MANKKVIFVDVRDIINVPSQGSEPMDCTDFQLKYWFVKALRDSKDVVRVNLFDSKLDMSTNAEIDGRLAFLRVVEYWLYVCTDIAVTLFPACIYHGEEESLKVAIMSTKNNQVLGNESNWLFVGSEKLADKFGIDFISMKDFTNGAYTGTEGTETAKEGQAH